MSSAIKKRLAALESVTAKHDIIITADMTAQNGARAYQELMGGTCRTKYRAADISPQDAQAAYNYLMVNS